MPGKRNSSHIRFWEKVNKTNTCWNWTAGTFSNGYGQFFTGFSKICAHRFSYIEYNGMISNDLKVCHNCDNRKCVNPNHLFLGTQKENIQDMIKKGRKVNADTTGSKNGRAKLTSSLVKEIRNLYSATNITGIQLAKDFNISETQIYRILNYETWRNLK